MSKLYGVPLLLLLLATMWPATLGAYTRNPRLEKNQKNICKGKPLGSKQPNPMACNTFFACTEYGPEEGNCPENMLFDTKTLNCEFATEVFCNIIDDSYDEDMDCPNVDDGDLLTYKNSITHCARYVVCLNSFGFLLTCPPGLWWNQNKLECDNPKNVKCTLQSDGILEDPDVPDEPEEPEEVTSATTVPATKSTTPSVPATRFDCPNTGDAFIPHPVNCNWFFYCHDGISSLQQCPFLKYFDVDKRRCIMRNEARCALAVRRERI